jgi:hypothetical protein
MHVLLRQQSRDAAIGVLTLGWIQPWEELTIDYAWTTSADKKQHMECKCGSKKCKQNMYALVNPKSDLLKTTLKPKGNVARGERTTFGPEGNVVIIVFGDLNKLTVFKNFQTSSGNLVFRKSCKRTISGFGSFEVQVGDHVELYYDAFKDQKETSKYNSIMKILLFIQDISGRKSYAYGRWYR